MKYPKRSQYKYAKSPYRIRNWPQYEAGPRRRGDLTVWLSDYAVEAWRAPASGQPGGQRIYANVAIEAALAIRMVLHLPLRPQPATAMLADAAAHYPALSLAGLCMESESQSTNHFPDQGLLVTLKLDQEPCTNAEVILNEAIQWRRLRSAGPVDATRPGSVPSLCLLCKTRCRSHVTVASRWKRVLWDVETSATVPGLRGVVLFYAPLPDPKRQSSAHLSAS